MQDITHSILALYTLMAGFGAFGQVEHKEPAQSVSVNQQRAIDEIVNDTELTNSEKALVLNQLGSEYYRKKSYGASIHFYRAGTSLDTSAASLTKSAIGVGYGFRKLQMRDSALFYIRLADSIHTKLPRSLTKATTAYKIAFIYKEYGFLDTSLSLLLDAYDALKLFDDKTTLVNVCNTIALIHRLQGKTEAALLYYHKAKGLRQQLKDTKGLSSAYNNLANAHKTLKNLDSALLYYNRSLQIKQENSYPNQGYTLHNIGTVHYLKDALDSASTYYQKALTAKRKDNDSASLVYTYNELGLVAMQRGELARSGRYLDSAARSIRGVNETALRWHELKAKLYAEQGDFPEAHNYQSLYIELYKKLYDREKSKTIIDNQDRYDTAKKEETIEVLTVDNDQKTELLHTRTLYLVGAILVVLLLLILYVYTRQRQRLILQRKDIENLQEFYKSQDTIKNNIGRDLHDIVKARYEGIRLMVISLAKSKNLDTDVRDVVREIVEANAQVKTLSHRLSPLDQRIGHSSLNQILKTELNKFQLYSQVKIVLIRRLPDQLNNMELDRMGHLYGIFQEALTNVSDHSEATELFIDSSIEGGSCLIVLSDNSINTHGNFVEGVGIGNMKSRARLMGGIIRFDQDINGFTIRLRFPLTTRT